MSLVPLHFCYWHPPVRKAPRKGAQYLTDQIITTYQNYVPEDVPEPDPKSGRLRFLTNERLYGVDMICTVH